MEKPTIEIEVNKSSEYSSEFLNDEEKVVAEKILNILSEHELLIKSATSVLDTCKELLKFNPVINFKII